MNTEKFVVRRCAVITNAGTFLNCFVIKRRFQVYREDLDSTFLWFAPNVGLVREAPDDGDLLIELTAYTIQ